MNEQPNRTSSGRASKYQNQDHFAIRMKKQDALLILNAGSNNLRPVSDHSMQSLWESYGLNSKAIRQLTY